MIADFDPYLRASKATFDAGGKRAAMEECMSTNATVPRINLVDPENAPQPIKDALSRLPVINAFRALANAEFHTYGK